MTAPALRRPAVLVAIIFLLLMAGCGKKGAPTLKSYEKPAAPSGLTAINRENRVSLRWSFPRDKEAEVQEIVILRSGTGEFTRLASTEASARSYVDSAINPGVLSPPR